MIIDSPRPGTWLSERLPQAMKSTGLKYGYGVESAIPDGELFFFLSGGGAKGDCAGLTLLVPWCCQARAFRDESVRHWRRNKTRTPVSSDPGKVRRQNVTADRKNIFPICFLRALEGFKQTVSRITRASVRKSLVKGERIVRSALTPTRAFTSANGLHKTSQGHGHGYGAACFWAWGKYTKKTVRAISGRFTTSGHLSLHQQWQRVCPCSVTGLRRCPTLQCPRSPQPTLRLRWQPQL